MTEKMDDKEKEERKRVVQTLSVRDYDSQKTTADFVVNEVANGKMTGKQADTINTAAKVVQNGEKSRLGYLRFYYEVYKMDGMASDNIIKKADTLLPRFFFPAQPKTRQLE